MLKGRVFQHAIGLRIECEKRINIETWYTTVLLFQLANTCSPFLTDRSKYCIYYEMLYWPSCFKGHLKVQIYHSFAQDVCEHFSICYMPVMHQANIFGCLSLGQIFLGQTVSEDY